ncbi:MAG: endonuclease III [Deltaproteobacteria bacterium]|nr:endonuclease III [Deltaproteobacteria bacterium]
MPTTQQRARALKILDGLAERFPEAKIELDFRAHDPWQLLVAVVLSAQSTDAGVNKVTPALFAALPDVRAFAAATPQQVEGYIKSLGLFRNKAKSLVGAAQAIVAKHGGEVPRARALLEELPGVGAKSAAVIVANAFGEPAIAVDTHVGRVSRRMGLTTNDDPSKVEADLTALLPRERLLEAHHSLIWHGRRICHARKPRCEECPIERWCHKVGVEPPATRARPLKRPARPARRETAPRR